MKNPCRRDCPDREPGCCCEARREWLAKREAGKQKERKRRLIEGYQIDAQEKVMRQAWPHKKRKQR